MKITKPFDAIAYGINKTITIELKNGRRYEGVLRAFDVHINCVLENVKEYEGGELKREAKLVFIRGDTIVNIFIE